MYRSLSTSRASDEFLINVSSHTRGSSGPKLAEIDQFPTYDPFSDIAKKEFSQLRSAERAVHLIPIVLVVCAIVLWLFSHPVVVLKKGDSTVARVDGLTINGYTNQTSSLPAKETDVLGKPERITADEVERSTEEESK